MIKAVKKDTGSFVYMKVQKHLCPKCGEQMKVIKMKKVVKARSKEASGFDMSAAGHSLGEKVKFIWLEFKCPECEAHYTENALRKIEKKAKEDAAKAKKEEKKVFAKEQKAKKRAAAKEKKAIKKAEATEKKTAKKTAKQEKKTEKTGTE